MRRFSVHIRKIIASTKASQAGRGVLVLARGAAARWWRQRRTGAEVWEAAEWCSF